MRFGAHGWMSIGEIGAGQAALRHDDLVWLVRRQPGGDAEGARRAEGGTTRSLYRLTAPGLRAEALDAVPAPGGRVELVEARVPEEAGPTAAPRGKLATGSGSRRRRGAAGRR